MIRKSSLLAFGGSLLLAAALPMAAAAQDQTKTFYWISHGDPRTGMDVLPRRRQPVGRRHGHAVNTSFHSNDVAPQQEAVRSAIAAGADGIVTTSPDPGSLVELTDEAHAAGIPIININTPDPTATLMPMWAPTMWSWVSAGRSTLWTAATSLRATSSGCRSRYLVPPTASTRPGHRQRLRSAWHHLGSHRRHLRAGHRHRRDGQLPDRQSRQDRRHDRPG